MADITIEKLREANKMLMACSDLTFNPIGIKFAKDASEVPSEAIFPFRDTKQKWAVCQLIQKARHEKVTYAMTVEDHWCWYPLISYGHEKLEKGAPDYEITLNNVGIPDREREVEFVDKIPHLEHNSNYATLIGTVDVINYIPDVILVYCDNAQILRRLIGAIKYVDGDMLETQLDYVNSCCWSILPTYQTRKYRVTIPDPGEHERAEIGASEIILSVPTERFEQLAEIMDLKESRFKLRPGLHPGLVPYFPRPEFIDNLYKIWGLEHGRNISWTEKERGY